VDILIFVTILKVYLIILTIVLITYAIRHFIFTASRSLGEQKMFYQDIIDSELPTVTVFIPMHNEELVARGSMESILAVDYPIDLLEVIPLNDHSEDKTKEILDEFAAIHEHIKPFHRDTGMRGKPAALNDAMKFSKGDIVLVFDADYRPPKGIVRDLAVSFKDPEIGAVMGRVIPENVGTNLLTRLLDLERTGGYQVDQQARYNLKMMPQYGGTVGGFLKDVAVSHGGFDPRIITEDTELTFKLYINGWKVIYANRAECYEEAPETWKARSRQITRWARGHNQVLIGYLGKVIRSDMLNVIEKIDGVLLLGIYTVPLLLIIGIIDSLILFFLGSMNIVDSVIVFLLVASYSSFGNAAPFFQIGYGAVLDGGIERIKLLPIMMFNFVFYLWYISKGSFLGILDALRGASPEWQKTERFRKQDTG